MTMVWMVMMAFLNVWLREAFGRSHPWHTRQPNTPGDGNGQMAKSAPPWCQAPSSFFRPGPSGAVGWLNGPPAPSGFFHLGVQWSLARSWRHCASLPRRWPKPLYLDPWLVLPWVPLESVEVPGMAMDPWWVWDSVLWLFWWFFLCWVGLLVITARTVADVSPWITEVHGLQTDLL